jgi:nickel-dependent lactate racemase
MYIAKMRVEKYHTKLFGTKFILNVVYESQAF